MKTVLKIVFILFSPSLYAQNGAPLWDAFYKQQQSEKVYAHINNVVYFPEETVYYKLYVTGADNRPTVQSDYVYVDIFDASGRKADAQVYLAEQGGAAGSFTIGKDMASGMYLLKAYTKFQQQLGEPAFEKHFFVQKVIAPRVLMTLDFKRKGYGAGELCEADFVLKNKDNQPIRNQPADVEIFIDGKNINTATAVTDNEGKATLRFKLPEGLTSNDGIINVKVDYDNLKESITRSIPINLDFADLQFLPESGNYIVNQPAVLFFISKNEFGKPLDISGYIQDEAGNKVQDFTSFYNGMGKVAFTPKEDKSYVAVITAPFKSKQKYALPAALPRGYGFSAKANASVISLDVYAPDTAACSILIRNRDKIFETVPASLKQGNNAITIPSAHLPVGVYAVSLVADDRIYAERLVFLNYSSGFTIDIQTNKKEYKPREKVDVTATTRDKDGNPVASSLSVSVVDEKLLSYIDDKQHNLLTWMFLGFETKGDIYEPRFYFDEKEPLEKRLAAIDLLLNTHGWRRYAQDEINKYDSKPTVVLPEKSSDVEGFVFNHKGKRAALKVYLISDSGKVYETHSSELGYFKFSRTHFDKQAWLAVESKKKKPYTIKNSMANLDEVRILKDSLKVSSIDYKVVPETKTVKVNTVEELEWAGNINLGSDANALSEVVVIGYGSAQKRMVTSSITTVTSRTLTQTLEGRVAGVQVQSATGQPGGATTISIRGNSSIYGSRAASQPLYIIDGVPYANNENASVFNTLSPMMIESIAILKDAGASSLYGPNTANGIIIITTKNGGYGKGILLGNTRHYTFQDINKNNSKKLNTPAAFYVPVYKNTITDDKTDFRNCIYWNATVQTNAEGTAQFHFYNSDDSSTFSILAEGTSYKGDLGQKKYSYVAKEPLQADVKLPLYATQEDIINIPVWLKNDTGAAITVRAEIAKSEFYEVVEGFRPAVVAANTTTTVYIVVKALKAGNKVPVNIHLSAQEFSTSLEKVIDIYAKGFPVTFSVAGTANRSESFTMAHPVDNTLQSELKFIINPYSALTDGLEGMLREPHGCFEQVSSSNYPNIMALQLLTTRGTDDNVKQKALGFLSHGYQALKNYESKGGGFEWYGGNPGHEALTAYGLLQFYEMKDFIAVDKNLVERSVKWLYSRKDGKGGFKQNKGKYGFSDIKYEVNNAYIVYVLSEIGEGDIEDEYKMALAEALKSQDIYRMSLLASAAYNRKDLTSYGKLTDIIKNTIDTEGYAKPKVEQTIVNSYNNNATIVEWVSLYALAIMKQNEVTKDLVSAIDFLQSSKKMNGFGSTQATALALKAVTQYYKIIKTGTEKPSIAATLNNTSLNTTLTDGSGNITIPTAKNLNEGENTFAVTIAGGQMVPYLLYVNYMSFQPANSAQCVLDLKTKVTRSSLKVSETTRIEVQLTNKSKQVVQNPIARIGLPGGASPEPWQLKELIDKEIVDYYEIFNSELVLYFREMNALETRKINIDLKGQVPGTYQGVSSSAYLYYNDEHKIWNSGLSLDIAQ